MKPEPSTVGEESREIAAFPVWTVNNNIGEFRDFRLSRGYIESLFASACSWNS
jgi:hypothetical protein